MRGVLDGGRYEILFADGGSDPGLPRGGWIRTKTRKCGKMLNIDSYPMIVNPAMRRRAEEERIRRKTGPAQERLNEENSRKRFVDLLDSNFGERDVSITLTYDYGMVDYGMSNYRDRERELAEKHIPEDGDAVKRDMQNFIRRVKNRIKKRGGDPGTLKYMWVIEEGREPRDEDPRPNVQKYHLHMVMGADAIADRRLDREEIESLWGWGLTRVDRIQPDNNGLKRLGQYLTKQRRRRRRWGRSRGLKEPVVRIADRKISARRQERIAREIETAAREIYERLYPGYVLVERPRVRYSDFVPGAYISARMRRRD